MRALQWFGRADVRLAEVEDPAPPDRGEIAVDVEWCGICGTDVEEFTDGPILIPTDDPHALTGLRAPMTLGHEVAGRISAVGPGVDLKPEMRVALDGYLACGHCAACLRHQPNRCATWAHIGFSHPGGLAERMVVPARMALPAPDHVPLDQVALSEPFAVAVRANRRGRIGLGDRVAILGGGTIGLAALQVALTSGCSYTALVDPLVQRRAVAVSLGASDAAASAISLVDGGLGESFDVVVDCTGIPDAPGQAVQLARTGGRIVLVGIPPVPGTLDFKTLVIRELSMVGTVGHVYDEDTLAAVALIASKRVDAGALISHRLPLERTVDDGFRFLAGEGRASALKVLVSPKLHPDSAAVPGG